MDEEKRELQEDERRLQTLEEKAKKWHKKEAVPISNENFNFILRQGGTLTENATPYVDNCYLSKAKIIIKGREYKFKTLTENKFHFEPPF